MTHEISNVLNYRKLSSLPHFYLITTRYFYCQIHAGLLMTFIWHTMASEINHRSVFFKDTHEDRFLRLLSMLRWFSQLQLTTLHVLANLSLLTYLLNKNAFTDSEKLDLLCYQPTFPLLPSRLQRSTTHSERQWCYYSLTRAYWDTWPQIAQILI